MSRVGSTIPFELILGLHHEYRASELITRSPDPGKPPFWGACANKRRYSTDSGIPAFSSCRSITMVLTLNSWHGLSAAFGLQSNLTARVSDVSDNEA